MDEVFGLKLLEENKNELMKRISRLEDSQIDMLLYEIGWKDEEKGKNKALPDHRIEEIKKLSSSGKELLDTFFQESDTNEIKVRLKDLEIPAEIKKLTEERQKARKNKDWKKSDELRDEISKKGWKVVDGKDGFELEKI
jgi:cysteinyl-tRNA synthetase